MPEISVVVPTFNRCGLLIKCLKSLFEQDLDPASYEVIVVVDGSTDRTMDELAAVRARCRFEYRLQPNSGAAAARNRGLALAAGNIVLFVDDDMIADRGLLLAHLAEHGGYHDAAVVGSVEMIAGHSTRLAMQVFDSLIDRQSSAIKDPSHLNPHDLLTGNFSIFRERLLGIGGFDADLPFGEDFELGLRLLKAGVRIRYCGRARSQEIYTRGNELVTREPYWRGLAHGRIARKHPRATVLLKLDRFYMGSMPLRLMRLLAWYAPPALARLARSPGALYWAGVAAGIGSMSMFSTLARQRLIVLCYHMVDDNLSQSIATYSVTVQQFHRQMEFLHQQGYSAVTLREWFALSAASSICRQSPL